jgi:hypothetical protein
MRGVRVRFIGNELRAVHSLLFGLAVRISDGTLPELVGVVNEMWVLQ